MLARPSGEQAILAVFSSQTMAKREERTDAEERARSFEELANREMVRTIAPGTSRLIKFIGARKLFEAAADGYRVAGKWRNAAQAIAGAAEAELRANHPRTAATYLAEAGDFAVRSDHELAISFYGRAITIMAREGLFEAAAMVQRRVADLQEEDGDYVQAAVAWAFVAELYLGVHNIPQTVYTLYRAGVLYVEADMYVDACRTFQRAAKITRGHNITQYKIPSLLFDACLAVLGTGEIPDFEDTLAQSSVQDMNFAASRERRYLLHIVECAVRADMEGFLDHTWNMDYVVQLKPHQLKILKRVFNMFQVEVQEEKLRMAEEAQSSKIKAKLGAIKTPREAPASASAASGAKGAGAVGAGAPGGTAEAAAAAAGGARGPDDLRELVLH